jgi:toxin ParE1/3/4
MAPEAESDLQAIKDRIARDKPRAAISWVKEIRRCVRSLRENPERYEVIPEDIPTEYVYRHLLHGIYRIIYRVETKRVLVIRVIHGARLLRPSMLPET